MYAIKTLVIMSVFLAPEICLALSSDRDQPVILNSASLNVDDEKQQSVFQGNVLIRQGSIIIKAERVTTIAENDNLNKVLIEGNPASFRQLTDEKKEIKAQANRIEYFVNDNQLILLGNAKIAQDDGNVFAAERIVYDTERHYFDAGKSVEKNKPIVVNKPGRIHMTIIPDDDETKP